MREERRLFLLIPKKSQQKKTLSIEGRREMNLEEPEIITRGKDLITVVKRDSKTVNRKKVFNTLTKYKIKYPSYKT